MSVESNFVIALVLLYCALCLVNKTRATFSTNEKQNRSHAFSRAWRRLHVFASNSDWFIALFTSVVIGQSNYSALYVFHYMLLFYKCKQSLSSLVVVVEV